MIRQRHRTTAGIFLTGDLLATLAAFFAGWFLRFEVEVIPVTKNVPEFAPYLRLVPAILIVWPIVFYFHGLYQSRRGRSRVDEVLTIAMAVLVATVLLSVFLAWYRPAWPGSTQVFTFSRAFIGLFALADVILVAALRMTIRFALPRIRLSGLTAQRILVVGAGALGREITAKIQAHREIGFEVVGFLDDDPGKAGATISGVPVLGTLRQADEILATHGIDQVYIALPLEAHKKMLQMIDLMAQECVEIKLVPDVLQYAALRAGLEDVDGTPVINLSQVPLQGWSSMMKRAMDIGMALAVMVALIPIVPLIALLIWLEDRGPIFYRQERMGLDGKPFLIVKFRSMRVDAEISSGPVWAVRDDPRRTPRRQLPAPHLDRRAAADLERADGRHVDRRPTAGASDVRPRVQAQDPALHAAPSRQGRHHRLGAGARLARQHLDQEADPVRPLLHPELVARPRLQDPLDDAPPRAAPPQRVLARRRSLLLICSSPGAIAPRVRCAWPI